MPPLTYGTLSPEVKKYVDPSTFASFFKSSKTKKHIGFSNGSRPGNNINRTLPKSNISMTSNKTFGSLVVPPTSVGNTYSRENYNRSYKNSQGGRRRRYRKTRRIL